MNNIEMIEGSSESVKTEYSVSHKIYLKRKELCPQHDLKYRYKCMFPKCQHPYLCHKQECFESHFHNQVLNLIMFNNSQFSQKFQSVQKAIVNEQKIVNELNSFRKTIEALRGSITELFQDIDAFKVVCQDLKGQNQKSVLYESVDKYDNIINLQAKIKANVDTLRAKFLTVPIESKDIYYYKMKNLLQHYLKTQINEFSWDSCIQIWSTNRKSKGSEKFHERLQGRSNLLFLFIGQKSLIGSYYPDAYPSLQQKMIKSSDSFIFLHTGKEDDDFVTFKANSESDHHLYISDKLLVCHGNTPSFADGVRTFAKHFESIDYYLPSNSYLSTPISEQDQIKIYAGNLKLTSVKVMQVKLEK